MPSERAPRAQSWESLLDRFALFVAKPCLRSAGPDWSRPDKSSTLRRLRRQLERVRAQLPERPCELEPTHMEQVLLARGLPGRGAGKRPGQLSFWHGLWRAIIFDCDDYRCHFCGRSGEEGVYYEGVGALALRLELDHSEPRSRGGQDYVVANIRTACRTCNMARGRLPVQHFRTELLSLARALTTVGNREGPTSGELPPGAKSET